MRSTQLVVNLDNIKHNIKEVKKYLGNDVMLMPIVKNNAYGTYLNYCADILNEFKYVGVALLDEAISLREQGYKGEILILYPILKEELPIVLKENFIINGCNIFDILDNNDKRVRIHIEIDTGMGRTGVQPFLVNKYINKLKKYSNIEVDGIFTHLSSSGSDIEFSLQQIDKFNKVLDIFKEKKVNIPNIHVVASGGLKLYHDYLYNMVRVGLLIYGYYPNDSLKDVMDLKPCTILKTKISYLKEIDSGDTVGYNKNFIARDKTKIATIPFGFGDGLIGLETGEPYVIVKGKKALIVGICMDNMMIDVTDIKGVKVNDEVIIWDNELLTVETIGEWCNGICNYEVLSSITSRIPRVFL